MFCHTRRFQLSSDAINILLTKKLILNANYDKRDKELFSFVFAEISFPDAGIQSIYEWHRLQIFIPPT